MDLTLDLTHACTLACTYCFAGEKSARAMTVETGRAALDLALARVARRGERRLDVAFFGGEPLLERALLLALADEARARCRAAGVTLGLSVTTNGTLLTEAVARELAARDVHVGLSIDGLPEAQDVARPFASGRSSAGVVARALDVAVAHLRRFSVISVIDPSTVRWLAAGVRWLVLRGARDITLNPAWTSDWSDADLDAWGAAYEAIARQWSDAHRAGRPFSVSTIDRPVWRRVLGAEPQACGFGKDELAVAPSGRVYGCGRIVGEDQPVEGEVGARRVLGHVSAGLDDAAVASLRAPACGDDWRPAECRACALRDRCASVCACANVESSGRADEPGALLCWHERMSIPLADRTASALWSEGDASFLATFYGGAIEPPPHPSPAEPGEGATTPAAAPSRRGIAHDRRALPLAQPLAQSRAR